MRERILINFPTNLGDSIMSLPVLDRIKASYPGGKITAITSPRTKEFLLRNAFIDEVVVFDKFWRPIHKMRFSLSLRGQYDIAIDLKNSFLPFLLGAKRKTPFRRKLPEGMHAKDIYLKIAERFFKVTNVHSSDFIFTEDEICRWDDLDLGPSLFVACSSRSNLKRYPAALLKEVIQKLENKLPIIILGEARDRKFYEDVLSLEGVVDLVGQTKMHDVVYLFKKYARLLLCVDSSVLHLGSYLDIDSVALFGPTDPVKYGPWSSRQIVLRRTDLECIPCKSARCKIHYDCMKIEPQRVIKALEDLW